MKKILSAIISSPLKGRLGGVLFALLATTSLWAHDFAVNGIYYNILTDKTNEVSVTHRGSSYDSYSNEYTDSVTIPSTVSYNGLTYSVTSIGGHAFAYCFGLTSVTIPNSAVTIEGYAFEDCSGLTSITIGNSVTSIGYSAFEGCSSLTSITIPNGVTSIGGYAFYNCSSLTTITIPNSVTSIGGGTFRNCSSLTTITIPNSLTGMGSEVFRGSGLTSVIWNAENCADFRFWSEDRPFYGCDAQVTSFTFGDSVKHIPEYLGLGMGVTSITIPNSVTSIGANVFSNCSNLTSVIWNAENCTDCDTYSDQIPFYGCPITSFTFGDGVKYIPEYLCYKMSNLTYIDIPNSVTSIGKYAFSGCSGLTSVNIGNSVTSIKYGAFHSCSGLTSITLPNCVTSIGDRAFYNCSSLTTITIPNNVTAMGEKAFLGCSDLASVIWNAETCDSYFSSPEYSPFYGCPITSFTFGDSVKYIPEYLCSGKSNLTSITIPNSVTRIGANAFSNCSNLTSVIWNAETCDSYFSSPEYSPFYSCSQITSFTFGDSVKYIPEYLCSGKSNLTSITIPNSVTSVGANAFSNCSNLTSIIWNAETCDSYFSSPEYSPFQGCPIASFTFGDSVKQIPSYLCSGISNLTSITIPNSVTSIGGSIFSGCSNLTSIIWNAENCNEDYWDSESDRPFYGCPHITSFTFGDSVKYIPNYLCSDMSSLISVNIGNNVTTIGSEAFSHCSGLTSITIPNSVTEIRDLTFKNCSSLTSVIWNAENCDDYWGTESYRPFYDCSQITSFTFGDSVKHIPAYLCYDMSSLTSIIIPNSVTNIGYKAFSHCSSLTSVIWNAENCDDYWGNESYRPFYDCSQITSFTFGDSVKHIPAHLCYEMSSLTSVNMGNSVTSIGYKAFSHCSSLSSITIPNSITSIGEKAFLGCSDLASVIWNAENCDDYSWSEIRPFYDCFQITSFTFGDSVKHIPTYLCYEMSTLTSITIPNSVTSIGAGAFYNCSSLDSVVVEAITPPTLGDGGNYSFFSSPTCYIPCGTLAAYQSSSWAEQVGSFVEQCDEPIVDANKCGDNLYWAYTDGTLTITGTGAMYNYDFMDNLAPWNSVSSNIKNIVLPEGLTSIGEWAFYLCASVTSISIPEGVSSIGVRAFCNCSSLTSISIPNSVTSVGERAFYNCYNLASVTLSTNLSKIDKYLFGQCRTLTAITIPNNVTAIENGAFSGCSSLDSVSIEATTPPVLSGSSTFSSSPTCYIPCGTLAAYQSSSWAQQVGSFVEQCDDNDNNQSLISVTDATLSDWDNLPMEYLFETKCVEGASWDALKSVKVYADLTYINLVVEWDTDIVTDLNYVPFHVYLNVDNDAPTGGFRDQWIKPNIDLLLEGYFYLDGNPCAYQPDVALYAGTPLANEWAWDWTTIESLAASQLITKGVMEIQIEYGKLPVKLENTFTIGFDIQQSWSSVGVLPNAANDNSGNSVLAEKMLVRINNVNTPTSVEDICSPSSITNTHKLLHDGQLLILHDGKTYTVMGAEIK